MPSLLNVSSTVFGDFSRGPVATGPQAPFYRSTGLSLLNVSRSVFGEFGALVSLGDATHTGLSLLNVSRSVKGEFGALRPSLAYTHSGLSLLNVSRSLKGEFGAAKLAATIQLFAGDVGRGTDGQKGSGVLDTFTDLPGTSITAHASDGGGTWFLHGQYPTSSARITPEGRVRSNNSGFSLFWHGTTPPSADYDVSADVVTVGTPIQGLAGVAGRVNSSIQTFYRFTYDYALDVFRIHKHVNGTQTQLATSVGNYTPPTTRLTLRMAGNQISGLANGTLVCGPVIDTSIAAPGRSGLFFQGIASDPTGLHVDEFRAYESQGTPEFVTVILFAGDRGAGIQFDYEATASPGSPVGFDAEYATASEGSWLSVRAFSGDRGAAAEAWGAANAVFAVEVGRSVEQQGGATAGTTTPWAYEVATGSEEAFVAVSLYAGEQGAGADGTTPPTPDEIEESPIGLDVGSSAELAVAAVQLFSGQVGGSIESAPVAVAVFAIDAGRGYDDKARGGLRSIAYHVYANTGRGDAVDYTTPVATVAGLSWTTTLPNSGVWKFGVRAFDTVTLLEERNADIATVVVDREWYDRSSMPAAPIGLALQPTKGGGLRAMWRYQTAGVGRRPVEFRVYRGTGDTPNYATPSQVVAYSGDREYALDLAGLVQGQAYTVGVRASNESGEEANLATATATADGTPPLPVEFLTATPTRDA